MKLVLSFWLLHFICTAFAQEQLLLEGKVQGYEGKVKLILNTITVNHEADMENEEVIYMTDGQFKIERKLKEPTLLSIRIRPEITAGFDPRMFESAFIWVDNISMKLIGEKGNFEYSDVIGYSRQDEHEESNHYVRDRIDAYNQSIDSISKIQTEASTEKLKEMRSVSMVYLRNKYRLEHSYSNPESFVSVYNYSWFIKWLPEMVPKSHAIDFYELLSNELKHSIPGRQIKNYIDNTAVNQRLQVGDKPYDFTLQDSASQEVTLSSFEGKIILLDFWSSGCGPCRKEHENYSELYSEYNDLGFEIISVSLDRRRTPWMKAMAKDGIRWVSLWDKDLSISKYTYLVSSIPDNYLINRNGKIIAKDIRGDDLRYLLTSEFDK